MRWLTVEEAAREIHRNGAYIREVVASGELKAWRPRDAKRGTLIHIDDLDDFVRGYYEPAMCANAKRRMRLLGGAR